MRSYTSVLPLGPVLLLLACAPERIADSGDSADSASPGRARSPGATAVPFLQTVGGLRATSPSWPVRLELDADGARLRGPAEALRLDFVAWGRRGDLQEFAPATPQTSACLGVIARCETVAERAGPDAIERWSVDASGARQSWELLERPEGAGPVVLELAIEGASAALVGDEVLLLGEGGGRWRMRELRAWDADGVELGAWFETSDEAIRVVVDDAGARWPLTVDPVTTTADHTFTGTGTDAVGTAQAGGDVNDDGYADLMIGAPGASGGVGAVYVYYGSATGPGASPDLTLSGPGAGAAFGSAIDMAGDVNDDGYGDVVIGAPGESTSASSAGRAYVYYGSASGLSTSSVTTLTGSGTASAYFGAAVAGVGDLNGDGYDDVGVGEYGYSSNLGRAWMFAGTSSGTSTTTTTTHTGISSSARYGYALSGGDITGDGYSDLVVGLPYYSGTTGSTPQAGRVTYYKGSSTWFTATTTGTNIGGTSTYQYGSAVSLECDVNGDGLHDLLVGAPRGASTGVGRMYYYEATSSGLPTGADGREDGPAAGSYFSAKLDCVGDVNADGYDDILVGAPSASSNAGYAALYEGLSAGITTAGLTPVNTWEGTGSDTLGLGVARAGDVNGDGYNDVLVGSPGATSGAGVLVLHYGGEDADGDGYLVNGTGVDQDCDDADSGINPGAEEVCDEDDVDEDCDGVADDSAASGTTIWYIDADSDGYGDAGTSETACDAPSGYVDQDGDCDDTDAAINPDALEVCDSDDIDEDCDGAADDASASGATTWYADADGDGFGDPADTVEACDAPAGYISDGSDCDDGDADINPDAVEICDADDTDEDCDGDADESGADGESAWYADDDGDGYGRATVSVEACDQPGGFVDNPDDCDDDRADISPDGEEICDGDDADEDCDGGADDADGEGAAGQSTFYSDADGDGFGDAAAPVVSCDSSAGVVEDDTDCDDTDAAINPDAVEVCDSDDTDEDCDGAADDDTATGQTDWYGDADEDGYGDALDVIAACDAPSGYLDDDSDCDDTDANINPGMSEICDEDDTDEDCDGRADDGTADGQTDWFEDSDGDGYGDASVMTDACDAPTGYVDDDTDCDDDRDDINPGAPEVCDEDDTDEDCDGDADEDGADGESSWYADADGDGYGDAADAELACDAPAGRVSAEADLADTDCDDDRDDINPGAPEVCDDLDVDEDCDGTSDEDGADEEVPWYTDADGDGHGDPSDYSYACDEPEGAVSLDDDCDDTDATVNPEAVEFCDELDVDEDCDGSADDSSALGQSTWYADADSDSYGDASVSAEACDAPEGHVADDTDCDDADDGDHPGAPEEIGNGDDEDCDGAESCYTDADEDGYRDDAGAELASADADCDDAGEAAVTDPTGDCDDGDAAYNPGASETDCSDPNDYNCDGSVGYADGDGDGFAACEECDDADAAINPDATEQAGDTVDQDCDGAELCLLDADSDGYLDGAGATVSSADMDCADATEAAADAPSGDCDDADATAFPGAPELCDDADNDCDDTADEDLEVSTWYTDADGDGHGDAGAPVEDCAHPEGTSASADDCDDADVESYPGATDTPDDGIDQDCDGADATSGGDDTDEPADDTDEPADDTDEPADDTDEPADDTDAQGDDTGPADTGDKQDTLCGCASAPDQDPTAALGALALAVLVRRRRR